MVKKRSPPSKQREEMPTKRSDSVKKMIVLLSMILIGILLIVYRSDNQYWSDKFITYNQILFGISALLLVLIILVVLMDIKRIIMHELLGFIIFLIGALIIMLVPAQNLLGLELGEMSIGLYAAGAAVIVIGTLVLMRNGGFIGVCFFSVIINALVSAFYVFGNTKAIQYNSNTLLLINISIIFFIISFILLIYHDVKFLYLAKIIKEERVFRGNKNYKKALTYCEKALRIYPFFATAWNNKGNVLINMGKKKDAIKCYQRALEINPEYMPAKKNLQLVQKA